MLMVSFCPYCVTKSILSAVHAASITYLLQWCGVAPWGLECIRRILLNRVDLACQLTQTGLANEDLLVSLVKCLIHRLKEDETISTVVASGWLAGDLQRVAVELERRGCKSDALCKFLLADTLDLRKHQLVSSIHEIVQSSEIGVRRDASFSDPLESTLPAGAPAVQLGGCGGADV